MEVILYFSNITIFFYIYHHHIYFNFLHIQQNLLGQLEPLGGRVRHHSAQKSTITGLLLLSTSVKRSVSNLFNESSAVLPPL